jgi:hypothetical protein
MGIELHSSLVSVLPKRWLLLLLLLLLLLQAAPLM